jgi:hypothetical protein
MQARHSGRRVKVATSIAALFALAVLVRGPAAAAAPGLLVGVTDDAFLWNTDRAVTIANDLGLSAFRVSVQWSPGQTALDPGAAAVLDRTVAEATGLRIVVTVYGKAANAPTDDASRSAYCGFVRDVLIHYPQIRDVVIWNEANLGFYWQPQYDAAGDSVAPAAYERLLAQCWDDLHAARPDANVIMTTSPSGNDNPQAASNVSHSPGAFIRAMGAAYRKSGRTLPIFDTVGHNPYGMSSAEPPWQQHLTPSHVGEGDLDRLVQALRDAFGATAQPVPGSCVDPGARCVSVWYLEAGYQTIPDAAHQAAYTGRENDAQPVTDAGSSPTQSTQLTDGILLAYCQPYVTAFFNFLLWDERDLARWQSGVLWVDDTPKASYAALAHVIAQMRAGQIDCAALARSHASPTRATGAALVDRVEWPAENAFSVFNVVWQFGLDVRADSTFRAGFVRADGRGFAALSISGRLSRGHPRLLTFPPARLPRGRYRIQVLLRTVGVRAHSATLMSPVFSVLWSGELDHHALACEGRRALE